MIGRVSETLLFLKALLFNTFALTLFFKCSKKRHAKLLSAAVEKSFPCASVVQCGTKDIIFEDLDAEQSEELIGHCEGPSKEVMEPIRISHCLEGPHAGLDALFAHRSGAGAHFHQCLQCQSSEPLVGM